MEEKWKNVDKLSNQLTDLRFELWAKYTLFTWQWWMLLALCIVMSVLFIVLVKKEELLQTIAYFGIVFIINKYLDDFSTAFDWYDYRMQLEPIIPTMLPANFFVIPMGLSIIYQRYERWKAYLIALGVFSGFVSFVSLPLMKMVGIYSEKTWNAGWSFFSLMVIGIVAKAVIDRVEVLQKIHSQQDNQSEHPHRRGLNLSFPFFRWSRRKEKVK